METIKCIAHIACRIAAKSKKECKIGSSKKKSSTSSLSFAAIKRSVFVSAFFLQRFQMETSPGRTSHNERIILRPFTFFQPSPATDLPSLSARISLCSSATLLLCNKHQAIYPNDHSVWRGIRSFDNSVTESLEIAVFTKISGHSTPGYIACARNILLVDFFQCTLVSNENGELINLLLGTQSKGGSQCPKVRRSRIGALNCRILYLSGVSFGFIF